MINKLLKKISNNILIRNSLIMYTGMIVVSISNYLFNVVMGRFLGPNNYGILASLISIFLIIGVFPGVIQLIANRLTSAYKANNNIGKICSLLFYFSKRLFIIGIFVFILFSLLSGKIAEFLNIPFKGPVILFSIVFLFSFLIPLNRGILGGMQKFKQLSINSVIDPLVKLILGIILVVYFNLLVDGAIIALVIGGAVAYFFTFFPLKPVLFCKAREKPEMGKIKSYSFYTFLSLFGVALLYNVDVILVKHLFDPYEAGLYSALATLGKIIFFASGVIVGVMFPMISEKWEKKKDYSRILRNSILGVVLISIFCLFIYLFIPNLLVKLLYGSQFLSIAPYLFIFGVTMALFALVNLLINFYLSIKRFGFLIILVIGVILQIILILLFHQTIFQVVMSVLAVMTFLVIGLLSFYFISKNSLKSSN